MGIRRLPARKDSILPIVSDDEQYKFTTNSYSEKNLYCRSVDSKGHQRQVRVNAPPTLVYSITQVYRELGYSSVEAFFRDAAVHRLRFWQKQEPDKQKLAYWNAAVLTEALKEEIRQTRDMLGEYVELLRVSQDSEARLSIIVGQLEAIRDGMPDYMGDFKVKIDELINSYNYR